MGSDDADALAACAAAVGAARLHRSDDAVAQAAALADRVADDLRAALAARGRALLAVSGGRSPVALFAALRTQALDWAAVTVVLVDERVVPVDHPDSNTALVRRHLLADAAARATFVPFFDTPGGADADALAAQADRRLATLAWPLDVVLLGMGEDGHTASLFPAAPGLDAALAADAPRVVGVRPAAAPHARLTLSLSVLRAARQAHLAIAGAAKQTVLAQACRQPDLARPVSLLLHDVPRPPDLWIA